MRRPKFKAKPEKVIQREILDYLETTGLLFWRQNSGLIPIPLGGRNRYGRQRVRLVTLGTAGLPDIISVLPPNGRMLGLEVKSEKGRLRPAQIAFREKLEAAGGIYAVVRSVEEARREVEKWLKDTPTSPLEGLLRPSDLVRLSVPESGAREQALTLTQSQREWIAGGSLQQGAVLQQQMSSAKAFQRQPPN